LARFSARYRVPATYLPLEEMPICLRKTEPPIHKNTEGDSCKLGYDRLLCTRYSKAFEN
jgi:hypothetical protein